MHCTYKSACVLKFTILTLCHLKLDVFAITKMMKTFVDFVFCDPRGFQQPVLCFRNLLQIESISQKQVQWLSSSFVLYETVVHSYFYFTLINSNESYGIGFHVNQRATVYNTVKFFLLYFKECDHPMYIVYLFSVI